MMSSFSAQLDRRIGLRAVWSDHVESWTNTAGVARKAERRHWYLWFFGAPTLLSAPFAFFHLELQGIGQILSGTAVFTGLLFGMLGVVFNMGVTLRKDGGQFPNAHNLPQTISDLRANITYAIVIGLLLSVALVIASATSGTAGLPWLWTPLIVWLFIHLGQTLMMVLRRFRTAFNYITR